MVANPYGWLVLATEHCLQSFTQNSFLNACQPKPIKLVFVCTDAPTIGVKQMTATAENVSKKAKATPADELEALRAELAAARSTIDELKQAVAAKGSRAPRVATIPADKMAPEGTPLGTVQRAERGVQVEALAKLGRMVDPATMCDTIIELAERFKGDKSLEDVVTALLEAKKRAPRAKKVEDATATPAA